MCIVYHWCVSDSGVGAGIDSYYEYCLKAYVLLGDETYLRRFSKVRTSVELTKHSSLNAPSLYCVAL